MGFARPAAAGGPSNPVASVWGVEAASRASLGVGISVLMIASSWGFAAGEGDDLDSEGVLEASGGVATGLVAGLGISLRLCAQTATNSVHVCNLSADFP